MDPFDLWQVVPRQVYMPRSHLLNSAAFAVVSQVGCLRVTSVCITHFSIYSRTSVARILMAHLPWVFQTHA